MNEKFLLYLKSRFFKSYITDNLTKIANVDGFTMFLGMRQAKGKLDNYAVIYINLKNFKYHNKILSYQAANDVLAKFSSILRDSLSKEEIIARLGGDNFIACVLKENLDNFLIKLTDLPIKVTKKDGTDVKIYLSCRAGVYLAKRSDSVSKCMDYCSIAYGESRKNNRNNIVFYDDSMQEILMKQRSISGLFKEALSNNEFEVYYQPKVFTKDHVLCGGEALVRWNKDGKIILPSDFIPVLEMEGSIVDLDLYVFVRVCQDLRNWIDQGIEPVRVSVNFSRIHLYNDNIGEMLLAIMNKYQIDGKYLEFEITESIGFQDLNLLTSLISFLKSHDISVSIDDFGIGYSSLNFIRNLDVDVIKLDKLFVDSLLTGNTKDCQLVKNVVHLIKDLDRVVIAEGVETAEQALFITEIHCDIIQGYLFDKPLTKDDFTTRLISKQY